MLITFSHSQVSSIPLVREVILSYLGYKLFPHCNRVDLYKYFYRPIGAVMLCNWEGNRRPGGK